MEDKSKIIQIDTKINEKVSSNSPASMKDGILDIKKSRGDIMENKYITEKDLRHSEEKTELKLQQVDSKIDSMTTILNNKIDSSSQNIIAKIDIMKSELENTLLKQEAAAKKEAESNKKWLIGIAVTIGIFIIKEFFIN